MVTTTQNWLDSQAGVLGSVLISPELAPKVAAETAETDYSGEFLAVYRAITALLAEGTPVDVMTVGAKLGDTATPLLLGLMDRTPTAAHIDAYIEAVKTNSRLTRIQELAEDLQAVKTMDEARSLLEQAQDTTVEHSAKRVFDMSTMLAQFYADHQERKREYISWGIGAMDDRIYADRGDVVVIGGYPSDGKSALMLQLAYHMSTQHHVGIFSFETSAAKLTDRLVAHAMQMPFAKIKTGALQMTDWQAISSKADAYTGHNLEIVEAAGMTVGDILGVTLAHRFDVIFIDYVQLISTAGSRRSGTRNEELAEISKALAVMARRHSVMVVELSQLRRPESGSKGGGPKHPTMSSLRESGQLEQDADVIMLLYRTEPEAENSARNLFVAKNKEGRLGQIELQFNGGTQTFYRNIYSEINRLAAKGLRESLAEQRAAGLSSPDRDNPFTEGGETQ